MFQQITSLKYDKMKQEEIKIRVSSTLKDNFQKICEFEETTMSNKINTFIVKEVKTKKPNKLSKKALIKKLIRLDVANTDGRIYGKGEILKMTIDSDGFDITELDRLNQKPLYGQFGFLETGDIIHKYNATHSITNLRIEKDWLIGDVTILNPSILPIIDNLIFRVRAFGTVDEKGNVKDLQIIGFDAVLKTEDKFKEDEN